MGYICNKTRQTSATCEHGIVLASQITQRTLGPCRCVGPSWSLFLFYDVHSLRTGPLGSWWPFLQQSNRRFCRRCALQIAPLMAHVRPMHGGDCVPNGHRLLTVVTGRNRGRDRDMQAVPHQAIAGCIVSSRHSSRSSGPKAPHPAHRYLARGLRIF